MVRFPCEIQSTCGHITQKEVIVASSLPVLQPDCHSPYKHRKRGHQNNNNSAGAHRPIGVSSCRCAVIAGACRVLLSMLRRMGERVGALRHGTAPWKKTWWFVLKDAQHSYPRRSPACDIQWSDTMKDLIVAINEWLLVWNEWILVPFACLFATKSTAAS